MITFSHKIQRLAVIPAVQTGNAIGRDDEFQSRMKISPALLKMQALANTLRFRIS